MDEGISPHADTAPQWDPSEWFAAKKELSLLNPLVNVPYLYDPVGSILCPTSPMPASQANSPSSPIGGAPSASPTGLGGGGGPVLLAQSGSILRAIARMTGTFGSTPLESLLCDELVDTVTDIRASFVRLCHARHFDSRRRAYLRTTLPQYLAKLEARFPAADAFTRSPSPVAQRSSPTVSALASAGGDGVGVGAPYFFGTAPTAADFAAFELLDAHVALARRSILAPFPRLARLYSSMLEDERMAAYLSSDLHRLPINLPMAHF